MTSSSLLTLSLFGLSATIAVSILLSGGLPARCVPGRQEHCGCPRTSDGHWQEGIQVCSDAGKRYSGCECRELP